MNAVQLMGRLTKDPEIRHTDNNMAVCSIMLAIDRPKRQGQEKPDTDFPRVVVFGKQAETLVKYVAKGCRVQIEGRIQTGSYKNKNGDTIYTTDVVASRVEFIDYKKREEPAKQEPAPEEQMDFIPTEYTPF